MQAWGRSSWRSCSSVDGCAGALDSALAMKCPFVVRPSGRLGPPRGAFLFDIPEYTPVYSPLQATASYRKGVITTGTEELFALPEAAERLGVSVYTVRRWIKDGRLKAFRPGKEYRIREADLEEFLAAREVRPKAAGRSSLEPSLLNGLEDERRATSLQSWIDLNN